MTTFVEIILFFLLAQNITEENQLYLKKQAVKLGSRESSFLFLHHFYLC
jgi:hypothetical protein